jgi:uncharacterized protein (DUF2267 family)
LRHSFTGTTIARMKRKHMLHQVSKYAEEANDFFRKVAVELGDPQDTGKAYRITRAVLHTLRQKIDAGESMNLVSQLPMLLKGIYVDGWKISPQPKNQDGVPEFLQEIRDYSRNTAENDFPDEPHILNGLFAVMRVLRNYVDEGEMEDIRAQMPQALAPLFV